MLDERARALLNYVDPRDVIRADQAAVKRLRPLARQGIEPVALFRIVLLPIGAWNTRRCRAASSRAFAPRRIAISGTDTSASEGLPWLSPTRKQSTAAAPRRASRRQSAAPASERRQVGLGVRRSSSKDAELEAYRDMLLIRRFEEKAGQMYGMGLIGGFCHLYIGQEAVVVGMQMALRARRPGHHRLSRPRPHAGLRHGPQGRDGRADRPPRRLFQGQGRLDAHVQPSRRTSSAATASSARRCRSAPASPSPTATARTTMSA